MRERERERERERREGKRVTDRQTEKEIERDRGRENPNIKNKNTTLEGQLGNFKESKKAACVYK